MNLKTKIQFIREQFSREGETKEAFVFEFLRSLKDKSESGLTPQEERYIESFLASARKKKTQRGKARKVEKKLRGR